MVFVFNKDDTMLMPTHPAKARILLKKKLAKVVKTSPFTIKLNYQIDNPKFQDVIIDINSGEIIYMELNKKRRLIFN